MAGRKKKTLSWLLILTMMLASCRANNVDVFTDDETKAPDAYVTPEDGSDGEGDSSGVTYENETDAGQGNEVDNPFVDTDKNPVSLVCATADTSSYKHFRDLVCSGYSLSELKKCSYSFKNEEFLNYFASGNATDEDFYSNVKIAPCSWNKDNYLFKFTFAAPLPKYIEKNNLVFYVDVSESMGSENMLPAVKDASQSLIDSLSGDDTISIITSESENYIKLDSVSGDDSESIREAIDSLEAHGSANIHDALSDAYAIAKKNVSESVQSKVIIISDGDISEKYSDMIKENADAGIITSVIALGSGNYKNEKLESLAKMGCGAYYYVDGKAEAEDVIGKKIFYQHSVVASDLSVRVDFDNSLVEKYRLIGYEGKIQLPEGEAEDSTLSLFYGDNITLCYEISLLDGAIESGENFADITVKYNNLSGDEISDSFFAGADSIYSDDGEMQLISCAIETLMVLRSSAYGKNIKLSDVYSKLSKMDFEEYPKAEELYNLLGIITGKTKK